MKNKLLQIDTASHILSDGSTATVLLWSTIGFTLIVIALGVAIFRAKPPEINEEKAEDGCTDDIY